MMKKMAKMGKGGGANMMQGLNFPQGMR